MNKRSTCPNCTFIKARCLCSYLTEINNRTRIIVLQHPSEKKHALNSVKLMSLCFNNIQIFTGENFSLHQEINDEINNNFSHVALLYPEQSPSAFKREPSDIRLLIVIDGTWKKAFKIYSLSVNLHSLPKISFFDKIKSSYRIRSSSKTNSLSSLEATNKALEKIEPDLDTKALTKLFEKMIDFQIEKMGEEIFTKNYDKKKGSD